MTEHITEREYARRRGCSQPLISRYVRDGKISRRSTRRFGNRILINPELADADLEGSLDPAMRRIPGAKVNDHDDPWDISDTQETVERLIEAIGAIAFVADHLRDGIHKNKFDQALRMIVGVVNGDE